MARLLLITTFERLRWPALTKIAPPRPAPPVLPFPPRPLPFWIVRLVIDQLVAAVLGMNPPPAAGVLLGTPRKNTRSPVLLEVEPPFRTLLFPWMVMPLGLVRIGSIEPRLIVLPVMLKFTVAAPL
jgi:hypothetical protein